MSASAWILSNSPKNGWMFDLSKFRNGWTHQGGHIPARVFQATVIDANSNNWTVDVVSKYDRITLLDIQVGTAYQHYQEGEGIFALPEVGAQCMVCLPSDTSPPFIMAFIMPMERVDLSEATGEADAPSMTASFGGGRPKAKFGDIMIRGRDGNFVTLHRGGVLQIGAGPLAQRIYIPLTNLVKDFAEEYEQHTQGGSIRWGIQEGAPEDKLNAEYTQTFRVFANSASADVRVSVGHVSAPVGEPVEAKHGQQADLDEYQIGSDLWGNYIVYELAFAAEGFQAESGGLVSSDTKDQVTLRFFFDKAGGFLFRSESSGVVAIKKNLRVKVGETLEIKAKNLILDIEEGITVKSGKFFNIDSPATRFNGGGFAPAAQGDIVQLRLPTVAFAGTVGGLPATGAFQFVTPIGGVITSGRSKVSLG